MSDTKKSTRRKTASKPSTPAPLTTAASPTKSARRVGSTAKPAAAPKVAVPKRAARPKTAEVQRSEPRLDVVMITPEAHPFAKTGGLAEVTAALPDALARLGHSVTIVMPRYRGIRVDDAGTIRQDLSVVFGSSEVGVTVYQRPVRDNVSVVFLDVPELFDREGLYGSASGDYADNGVRFAFFSRAALEYVRARGVRPSILHAHDWQAGLVPVYQKMHLSADLIVGGVPVVFTIHNLAFQGLFPPATLAQVGLGWEMLNVQAMEYWGQISYLKGGINFSEKITTVSPGYAKEIVRPELGFGFDGILSRRAADLVGILNGIDTERWNPERDPFVPASFSSADVTAKRDAKRGLLEAVGLKADENAIRRPVIGLVSRLTDQKGFDLIAAAADGLMALDAAWVMLGSGERAYEEQWKTLARKHPDRVAATIGFDERLAHLIEAGSDLFLMPSRFEPCGLNQMYSLRYGTIPVVRATGGLDDTVQDFDPAAGRGTGFKFREYSPAALTHAVQRALAAYRNPAVWQRIQAAGMSLDFSWDVSAREYVKVYRALLEA
jgi:starch synthase